MQGSNKFDKSSWRKTYKSIKHKVNIQDKGGSFKLLNYCKRTFLEREINSLLSEQDQVKFERDQERGSLLNQIKTLR